MIARHVAFVMLVALAGCSLELGPASPWVDASNIDGTFAPEQGPAPLALGAIPDHVRVVSFNVEKGADVEGLAQAIHDNANLASTDVLLLQEIEAHPGEGGSRASRLAAALGMGFVYAPERIEGDGTHGTAILSRWPLDRPQVMRLPYADLAVTRAPRIALAADVWIGDYVLHVIDLHLDTRLNATERILQLRPAVIDAPRPTLVGGDLNMNGYVWADSSVPQVPAGSVVDTDQAPVIDDYMRHLACDTPTSELGPTERVAGGLIESRLDAIYSCGATATPGAVERSITLSDHWPLFVDVDLR